jgi:hypothetical protein
VAFFACIGVLIVAFISSDTRWWNIVTSLLAVAGSLTAFYAGRFWRDASRTYPAPSFEENADEASHSAHTQDETLRFLEAYRNLERELQAYYRNIVPESKESDQFVPLGTVIRLLGRDSDLKADDVANIRSVVKVRNNLTHGVEPLPDRAAVRAAAQKAIVLTKAVQHLERSS